MNILKGCMEIWKKFKKVCGVYLRVLLVILGVAGALFAGHEFDVLADETKKLKLTIDLAEIVNVKRNADLKRELTDSINSFSNSDGWLQGFPCIVKDNRPDDPDNLNKNRYNFKVGSQTGTGVYQLNTNTVNLDSDVTNCRFLFRDSDKSVYDALQVKEGTVVNGFKFYNPPPGPIDLQQINGVYTTANVGDIKACIGKRPTVKVINPSGDDITNKFDITSSFTFDSDHRARGDDGVTTEPGHARYYLNNLKIKPASGYNLPSLGSGDLQVMEYYGDNEPAFEAESGKIQSYESSDGTLRLSSYDGGRVTSEGRKGGNIVIRVNIRERLLISASEGEWTNKAFLNGYDINLDTDLSSVDGKLYKVSYTLQNNDKDYLYAYLLDYDATKLGEHGYFNAEFRVVPKPGYDFGSVVVNADNGTNMWVESTSLVDYKENNKIKNKILKFKLMVMNRNVPSRTVRIYGKKYVSYHNLFKYTDAGSYAGYTLTDLISKPQWWDASKNDWQDINTWSDGFGKDVWTIASSPEFDGTGLNKEYRLEALDGYYLGDAQVFVWMQINGEWARVNLSNVHWAQDGTAGTFFYRVPFGLAYDFYPDGYDFVVENIKKHYDITFKPQQGGEANKYITINYKDSSRPWNSSIVDNLALNGDFVVNLECDSRKIFNQNADQIARDINNATTGLDGVQCVRNDDNHITLTIPHPKIKVGSTCEITIPNSVIDWKTTNVDFSIDMKNLADNVYKDEAFQSIELKKVNPETSIELREGGDSSLVNKETQTNISYGNVQYKVTLKNKKYVDLSQAKVRLVGDSPEVNGEVKIDSRDTDILVFSLDPNCSGASYRSGFSFIIENVKSNLKSVPINLCPKAILYFIDSNGQELYVATAPYDAETTITVAVPQSDGANYSVFYPDYTKIFNVDKVTGNCIEDKKMSGFNKVSFKINPGITPGSENPHVTCIDPGATAPAIKFTPVEGIKYYNVTGDEKTIDRESPIQGTLNIPNGKEFSFAVECNEGYDPGTLELKANDSVFGAAEGFRKEDRDGYYVFTISAEQATYAMTISGSIRAVQLQLNFITALGDNLGDCGYIYNGASISGGLTVIYGQSIAFEVTLPAKCSQSDITVKFNDEPLSRINGRYIINNITSGGDIRVEGAKINEYPITFASNARATYKNEDGSDLNESIKYVAYGGSFKFKVQPNTGYTLGEDSVVYVKYADGATQSLDPKNDVYTIDGSEHAGINQGCTVSVENVEDIVYTITLVPTDGVTYLNDVDNVIKGTARIKHGRNFEFSVSLSDEYDDSLAGMNIIVNGGKSSKSSPQKLASGRYVIPNVSEDLTIKVANVRKNTYTVTLRGAEGIDYYDASGRVITGDNQAEHHSDFSFKVNLYPAYTASDITVMLGDTPMSRDANGFYTISKISESKTVTVVGIELNDENELVGKINNLPDNLNDLGDVDDVIETTKAYESLPDHKKGLITNSDKLKALQEQVKDFHHVSNDVRVSGVDWYIKLYAIPISDDTDACGRIYKKLGSEYILSLYNVYLWNTLTDSRYKLPEGQRAVITLPTPNMAYFEKPTAIHEKESGKIEFINASINREVTTFETDSFSPMGIVANRSNTPGRSSLLDAADANLDAISNFAASVFGNNTNKVTRSGADDGNNDIGDSDDDIQGNIDEKFRSRNNKTTILGSALRLILVLMVLILIGLMIYLFMKRRKESEDISEK